MFDKNFFQFIKIRPEQIQSLFVPVLFILITLTPSNDFQISRVNLPPNLSLYGQRMFGLPFNAVFASTCLVLVILLITLRKKIQLQRLDYLVIVLLASAFISQFLSLYPHASLVWNLKLLFGVLCYFVFAHVVDIKKIIKPFTAGIVISLIIQIIFVFGQFIHQDSLSTIFENPRNIEYRTVRYISDGINYFRPIGTFSHPNILSSFFSITLPLLLYLIITYKKFRPYLLTLVLLMIICLLLTLSTFGLVTFIFSGVLFLILTKINVKQIFEHPTKLFLFLTLSAFGLTLLVFKPNVMKLLNPATDTYFPMETRRNLIIQALYTIKNHPFGIGPGSFPLYFYNNDVTPLHLSRNILYPVHNTLLLVTSELGIQGLIIFLLIFLEIIRQFIKTGGNLNNNMRIFQVALFCGLMAFYFNGLLEPRNLVGKIGTIYWIILGLYLQSIKSSKV